MDKDNELLHNYGPINPIPIGAIALCGIVSTDDGEGDPNPPKEKCCPRCLELTRRKLFVTMPDEKV